MSEQTDLVTGAYEAFARGDVPGVLERLDPAIHWRVAESVPHGGDFDGREGVGQFFAGIGESWADIEVKTNPPVAGNGTVVVTGRSSGHLSGGQAAGYGFAHVWTISDGRATRFDEYIDPDEMP
jgi:ketosteroid isomerase-like protein